MLKWATSGMMIFMAVTLSLGVAWADQPAAPEPTPPAPAAVPAPEPAPEPTPEPEAAPAPEPAPEPEPAPTPEPAPEEAETSSPEPTPVAPMVTRAGFKLNLPTGYREAEAAQVAKYLAGYAADQSALLVAEKAAGPDDFLGSVIILPLTGNLGGVLVDDAHCQGAAAAHAKQARGRVAWHKAVDLGFGTTCQWYVVKGEGSHHHAVVTRALGRSGQYTITCHFDERDAGGEGRCLETAAGFRFQ